MRAEDVSLNYILSTHMLLLRDQGADPVTHLTLLAVPLLAPSSNHGQSKITWHLASDVTANLFSLPQAVNFGL